MAECKCGKIDPNFKAFLLLMFGMFVVAAVCQSVKYITDKNFEAKVLKYDGE